MEKEIIKAVEESVKALRAGEVILFPTDTVWSLGCDATNPAAVEKLSEIAGISSNRGMVVLMPDLNMLYRYFKQVPQIADELIEVSDKPLTLILNDPTGLAASIPSGENSVAVRVVTHPFCTMMLAKFGRPVVTPTEGFTTEKHPLLYEEFGDEIFDKCQWHAHPSLEAGATGRPSSVISLGNNSIVKIIRN